MAKQKKRTLKPIKRPPRWPSPVWSGMPYGRFIEAPEDLSFLCVEIGGLDLEVVLTLGLDARMRLRSIQTAGLGSRDHCPVLVASVLRPIVQAGLTGVIVAHNHPSGVVTPSSNDLRLTEAIVWGGKVVGVEVIDHVIVARSRLLSLVMEGLMPNEDAEHVLRSSTKMRAPLGPVRP